MNWSALTALNELYVSGRTKKGQLVINDPDIKYLLSVTREIYEEGKYLKKGNAFDSYYQRYHQQNFQSYTDFLVRNKLLKPQSRYQEPDIRILMDIEERVASGDLSSLREQIIKSNETVRGLSLMFFKNEKYLDGRMSLIEALKAVLQVSKLADDRDQQYKYVLECDSPKCIVLCENVDFLKKPTKPRECGIELWYAGGSNVQKLKYADTRELPIFYSCDWDYDGLRIYKLVKDKIPDIKLLFPNGPNKDIIITEHVSHWNYREDADRLSGLTKHLFNQKETGLIKELIKTNCWIIEESNALIAMVDYAFTSGL